MRRLNRRVAGATILAGLAFYVTLIVNADYVRKLVQPDFDFGEPEMLQILGSINRTKTWRFREGSTQFELDVALHQVPGADTSRRLAAAVSLFSTQAHACGSRSFRQSASACLDTTGVPVEGKLTLRRRAEGSSDALLDRTVTGELHAVGRRLGDVALRLHNSLENDATSVDRDYVEIRSRDARSFAVEMVRLKSPKPGEPPIKYFVQAR